MATLSLKRAQPGTGPMEIRTVGEAASQSFHEGQFVYLVNGLATACASDGVVIYGMAMGPATGTTGADCDVLVANPTQNFRMTCSEATAAAVAATDLAVKVGIRVANNRTYVDPADTTNDAMVIKEVLLEGITASDLNPECIAAVLPEAIQGGAAAT